MIVNHPHHDHRCYHNHQYLVSSHIEINPRESLFSWPKEEEEEKVKAKKSKAIQRVGLLSMQQVLAKQCLASNVFCANVQGFKSSGTCTRIAV